MHVVGFLGCMHYLVVMDYIDGSPDLYCFFGSVFIFTLQLWGINLQSKLVVYIAFAILKFRKLTLSPLIPIPPHAIYRVDRCGDYGTTSSRRRRASCGKQPWSTRAWGGPCGIISRSVSRHTVGSALAEESVLEVSVRRLNGDNRTHTRDLEGIGSGNGLAHRRTKAERAVTSSHGRILALAPPCTLGFRPWSLEQVSAAQQKQWQGREEAPAKGWLNQGREQQRDINQSKEAVVDACKMLPLSLYFIGSYSYTSDSFIRTSTCFSLNPWIF
jgi:hypothetical protein